MVNNNNNKQSKVIKATKKVVEIKEVRKIMLNKEGKRVHLMNINMKNKLLKDVKWNSNSLLKLDNSNIKKIKDKYQNRLLKELKHYKINNVDLNKNVKELIKCRSKYFIVDLNNNSFLVKNVKDEPMRYISF